jgi:metallopeptidase YgjP-like protein
MQLIISSPCGFPGHATHLLTRGGARKDRRFGDRDCEAMKWPTNGSLTPAARLKRRVDAWAVKLCVMPRVIRVQRMTRKWGSCSTAGTITLALDLDDEDAAHQRFEEPVVVGHFQVKEFVNDDEILESCKGPAT